MHFVSQMTLPPAPPRFAQPEAGRVSHLVHPAAAAGARRRHQILLSLKKSRSIEVMGKQDGPALEVGTFLALP